jgi:hypothetical protein
VYGACERWAGGRRRRTSETLALRTATPAADGNGGRSKIKSQRRAQQACAPTNGKGEPLRTTLWVTFLARLRPTLQLSGRSEGDWGVCLGDGRKSTDRIVCATKDRIVWATPVARASTGLSVARIVCATSTDRIVCATSARRHILKRANLVSGMGALMAALRARPRTLRVSAGSMRPSSQRRAVA